MPEKPLMKKKTIVELAFVFTLIIVSIILIAFIRFAVFSSLSGYGAGAVFPALVAVILFFLAALAHFKPFEKKYVYGLMGATALMLVAYCIANPKCAFWEQLLDGGPVCESSTVFWLMLITMMLSVFSAIICALDFFRRKHREIQEKLV